jgi:mRNA interferase MazF
VKGGYSWKFGAVTYGRRIWVRRSVANREVFAPVIVIQNDVGNKFSPTVIAIPLTTKRKNSLPTHGTIYPGASGLDEESMFLAEQILTIDKRRMKYRRGRLTPREMGRVDAALAISIHLIASKVGYAPNSVY